MGHDDIVDAFRRAEKRITTCNRAGPRGYTHIHGPNYAPKLGEKRCFNHCVAIEKQTGTVVFRDNLNELLRGKSRLGKRKSEHDLGATIGTNPGSFHFGITVADILKRGTLDKFVEVVIRSCKKIGIW